MGGASDTYTKAQIDAMLAEKADSDDVYGKTAVDTMLNNKADGLGYDSSTGRLSLKRGTQELGNVTIKSGWKMPSATAFNQRVDRNWDGLGVLWEHATDVTADFDSGVLSQKIAANNFDDYDLGMQIIKTINIDGTNYTAHIIFAHANAFYGGYNLSAVVNTTNIGCIVFVEGYTSVWNDSNTDGGYISSKLRVAVQKVVNAVKAVIGESHMVSHSVFLTNAVSDGKASSWIWADNSYGEAMSASQACGTEISGNFREVGETYMQLAIFSHVWPVQVIGTNVWLRNVARSGGAASVINSGYLDGLTVGYELGVSPFIMIK